MQQHQMNSNNYPLNQSYNPYLNQGQNITNPFTGLVFNFNNSTRFYSRLIFYEKILCFIK